VTASSTYKIPSRACMAGEWTKIIEDDAGFCGYRCQQAICLKPFFGSPSLMT
jgi:hypothetical protein